MDSRTPTKYYLVGFPALRRGQIRRYWAYLYLYAPMTFNAKLLSRNRLEAPQPTVAHNWSRPMKHQPSLQFAVTLFVGLLSASVLGAQFPPITTEKFVYVSSVGSAPPPVTSSTVFNTPYGVAINQTGSSLGSLSATIFVADPFNNQVLAFAPGSSTPSMVFSSLPCTISVCATSPWILNRPTAVAATPEGNIWISDTGNDVVVEVNATSGAVMAFAGVGPNNTAFGCTPPISNCPTHPNAGQNPGQFFGPGPLAVSTTGDVYVADAAGDVFLGEATSGAFGLGCSSNPAGAANCPQAANFRIEVFTSDGTFFNSWGSFCSLSSTTGVIVDSNGNVIAGTAGNTCNTSALGAIANGDGQFAYVTGITLDNSSSNVYVSDADNNRVQKLLPDGTFILKWGGLPTGSGDGQFKAPGGIATDLLDNSIYVVDVFNDRIQHFDGTGKFFSKGGSKGAFEAQFDEPVGIATVPGGVAAQCFFAGSTTSSLGSLDCSHGFVVSEQSNQKRVQYLAARVDLDNDSITDDVDTAVNTFSNDFSNAPLGFTTTGTILDRGDQTFALYGVVSPSPQDLISVRTETFGGARPLQIRICGTNATLLFSAGTGQDFHCSTPTVVTEEGPVGFRFVGSDGTVATATLQTGDSLSFSAPTSTIHDNAGNVEVFVGGKPILLSPGQTTFADTTPPTTTAAVAPSPNSSQWNNTNVVVALSATDNPGGSGVGSISYSLSGAQTGSAVVPGSTASVTISAEGITTVTYFATDNAGNQESPKSLTVRVDKTPPTVACSASPNVLWPPNNKLVPVNVSIMMNDALSGPAGFTLISVTSNEPDSGQGDIQGFVPGTASTDGQLRAQRLGSGTGRVYTFTFSGADRAGNTASCTTTVFVPHDRGQ
jgi:hypothetical protein